MLRYLRSEVCRSLFSPTLSLSSALRNIFTIFLLFVPFIFHCDRRRKFCIFQIWLCGRLGVWFISEEFHACCFCYRRGRPSYIWSAMFDQLWTCLRWIMWLRKQFCTDECARNDSLDIHRFSEISRSNVFCFPCNDGPKCGSSFVLYLQQKGINFFNCFTVWRPAFHNWKYNSCLN